jgi:ABC-type dipeptide/oligopeptide/nickel transport system permease subunit
MSVTSLDQSILAKKSASPAERRMRALRRNPMAMLGLFIILFWAVAAIAAPFTGIRKPLAQDVNYRLKPPSAEFWFGTDELGRDVFSRVIYGAQISLPIGFVVIMFATVMGSLVGASAGYIGGVYDLLIMRLADITLAFPSIVLALAIAAVLGPSITPAHLTGPHSTQYFRSNPGQSLTRCRQRNPQHCRAQFHRPWRRTTHARMGRDDFNRALPVL